MAAKTPLEKFERFADVRSRAECWNWTGLISPFGYGLITVPSPNMTKIRAHRWSYEHFVGPIPAGLVLDHLCRNRKCVNPYHLEPVTLVENLMRGIRTNANKGKTHCKLGHEFTPQNTYMSNGKRGCKECSRRRAHQRTQMWMDQHANDEANP